MHICIQNVHTYDCVDQHSLMHTGRYRTPGWERGKKKGRGKKKKITVSASKHRLTPMLGAWHVGVKLGFVLEGYNQDDHQPSSHTETYLHAAVNKRQNHQTIIYVFTKPKMASSGEAASEENKCLVECCSKLFLRIVAGKLAGCVEQLLTGGLCVSGILLMRQIKMKDLTAIINNC